ncbi:hypothetical protein V3O24_03330 [Methylobacter sp. Wu8]|uniref:hypothetical protein n=1 Tax=Methylobacter sp. Wu8 TaxID=3118457 RepID=UPI002F3311A5
MNIKSISAYLAALTLSFNVYAVEVQEKPNISIPDPTSSTVKIALNQENSPGAQLTAHVVNSHTTPQATAEKPSELPALSVYLMIIAAYSIYGYRANSKNDES